MIDYSNMDAKTIAECWKAERETNRVLGKERAETKTAKKQTIATKARRTTNRGSSKDSALILGFFLVLVVAPVACCWVK